ncbi:hypothetical protein AHV85_09880 [Salmonella enterica]|nr:hypothetical protein [Salmonella enterica]
MHFKNVSTEDKARFKLRGKRFLNNISTNKK